MTVLARPEPASALVTALVSALGLGPGLRQPSAVVVVLAAALAAATLVPGRPLPAGAAVDRGSDPDAAVGDAPGGRGGGRRLLLSAAGAAGVLLLGSWGVALVPALVVVGAFAWARAAARRSAARTRAAERARRVVDLCEQLAADLAAGQTPLAAMRAAARTWPELAGTVVTLELGGDPSAALRSAARTPGRRGLRPIAAGMEVSARLGAPLGEVLDRVARDLRADVATSRLIEGELSSARATARLVALLPGAALLLARGTGADPLGFLLGTSIGQVCLAAGVALALAGVTWIDALAAAAEAPA